MKKGLIISLITILVLYLGASMVTSSKQLNWTQYLYSNFKAPYGLYAAGQYFPSLYDKVELNRKSFREIFAFSFIYDIDYSETGENSYLSISSRFYPTVLDIEAIFNQAELGSDFLIAAEDIDDAFLDSLGLEMRYNWSNNQVQDYEQEFVLSVNKFFKQDTVHLKLENAQFEGHGEYVIRKRDQINYFKDEGFPEEAEILLRDSEGKILACRFQKGEGSLILMSNPLIFSNIYLLFGNNEELARTMLSYLSHDTLVWTEFYEVGSLTATSWLRFLLVNPPLKTAYYTLLIFLLIYIIFTAKRVQRIIPIVTRPANASLVFIRTVGNLYFETGNNKNIFDKRVAFFYDHIRTKYGISTTMQPVEFSEMLHKKSGVSIIQVNNLVKNIMKLQDQSKIEANDLERISDQFDRFYQQAIQ